MNRRGNRPNNAEEIQKNLSKDGFKKLSDYRRAEINEVVNKEIEKLILY